MATPNEWNVIQVSTQYHKSFHGFCYSCYVFTVHLLLILQSNCVMPKMLIRRMNLLVAVVPFQLQFLTETNVYRVMEGIHLAIKIDEGLLLT